MHMSQDGKSYKRIRADEAAHLEGWELPQMGGVSPIALQRKDVAEVTVVEEEIAAERITVAELESIREAARLEGLSAGLEEGRAQGVKEGKTQGVEEGRKQGYEEGFAQGDKEIKRLQSLLQNMAQEFEAPITQAADELEQHLLKLVVRLSETVVGAELSSRHDLLQASIHDALRQLPEPLGRLKISVNPSDIECVQQISNAAGAEVEVIEDSSITAGGYKLDSLHSLVKHEVEARFSHVADQLLLSLSGPEVEDEQDS